MMEQIDLINKFLFRCLGSVTDCSYDTVTKNVEAETQQRTKRSVDEVSEYLDAN